SDRRLEGEALADMAFAHFWTLRGHHLPEGQRCADAAFAIAQEIGDNRLLARTLYIRASLDLMEPRLPEAEHQFNEALRIGRSDGLRDIVVQSQTLLGVQTYWRGDFEESIASSRDAEVGAREIHDGFNEVMAMSNRAFSHISRGDYREAFET